MRCFMIALFALVIIAVEDRAVQAQAPGRPAGPAVNRPTFSPYLNLLRRGNSPGVNYYGMVRPEIEAQKTFRSLQSQIADNNRSIADQSAVLQTALPGTGEKTVTFLNTGGYFMNLSPQGGMGAAFGAPLSNAGNLQGAANNTGNRAPTRGRTATPARR